MQKYGVSNSSGKQDDLRAARCGLAHQLVGAREVGPGIPAEGPLGGGHRHRSGGPLQMPGLLAHLKTCLVGWVVQACDSSGSAVR